MNEWMFKCIDFVFNLSLVFSCYVYISVLLEVFNRYGEREREIKLRVFVC